MNPNKIPCSDCAKIGVSSNIQQLYINFEETVTLCENNMCPNPLGLQGVCNLVSPHDKQFDFENVKTGEMDCDLDAILNDPVNSEAVFDLIASLDACPTDYLETPSLALEASQETYVNTLPKESQEPSFQENVNVNHNDLEVSSVTSVSRTYSKSARTKNISSMDKKPFSKAVQKNSKLCSYSKSNTLVNSVQRKTRNKQHSKTNPRIENNEPNIFAFTNDMNFKNAKSYRRIKKPIECISSNISNVGSDKKYFVRQWLAMESPRKAYPGYRSKSSVSLKGTSDGRSVTDSIPPSPMGTE